VRVPRLLGSEETLMLPVQQVITNERFSPVTMSLTVNSLVLAGGG
jgi:hypothetical protein